MNERKGADMGMVERVARAMARVEAEKRDRDEGGRGDSIDWFISQTWELCIPEARAAIAAMREPDDAMILAGINAWEKSPAAVVTQFRAMIDKALEGGG